MDKKEKRKRSGTNEQFGFKINEPFMIISDMVSHRCLQMQGNYRLTINTCKDERRQLFVFDQKTKTVLSQMYQDRSLSVVNNGRAFPTEMAKTNARWW